jgi:hypothetical protein
MKEINRLDDECRREALRNSVIFAQERALQGKKRREDAEALRNRDRWAHRPEMQVNSRAPPTTSSRSTNVSLNANPAPASSNMLISTNPSSPLVQQQVIESTHREPAPLQEQAGSFVPLAISATAGLNIQGM